jgi:cellulose biosynthesis protein BcsQ
MLIVVANNKGGQGKTLVSTLLVKYLLTNPENAGRIVGCDLDMTQQNFKDNLTGSSIPVRQSFDDIPKDLACVVDTPPSLDENTIKAVKAADLLIVPVVLGKHAVQGVMRIAEIRGGMDLRLLINEWDASIVQRQAESFLEEQKFNIVGKIPKYKRLAYNLDAGLEWFSGFPEAYAQIIAEILNKLLQM